MSGALTRSATPTTTLRAKRRAGFAGGWSKPGATNPIYTPSEAEFAQAASAFVALHPFRVAGGSEKVRIKDYTPFNEPNHETVMSAKAGRGARMAGRYFRDLNRLCQMEPLLEERLHLAAHAARPTPGAEAVSGPIGGRLFDKRLTFVSTCVST